MDLSDEISFKNNNNNIKIQSIKSRSNKMIAQVNSLEKSNSKIYVEIQTNKFKEKLIYYYLLPLWVLRKNKNFNSIYLIKDRICEYFSIEKINKLMKFKEIIEKNSIKSKMYNTELIHVNKNLNNEPNGLIDEKNQNIEFIK